jgi:hypothetical protein
MAVNHPDWTANTKKTPSNEKGNPERILTGNFGVCAETHLACRKPIGTSVATLIPFAGKNDWLH